MEDVLRELTEFELDAVSGGNPFSQTANGTLGSNNQENEAFNFIGIDQSAVAVAGATNNANFGNG